MVRLTHETYMSLCNFTFFDFFKTATGNGFEICVDVSRLLYENICTLNFSAEF